MKQQPTLLAGAAFLIAITAAPLFTLGIGAVFCVLLIAAAIVLSYIYTRRPDKTRVNAAALICFCAAVALASCLLNMHVSEKTVKDCYSTTVTADFTLLDCDKSSSGDYRYEVMITSLDGASLNRNVRGTIYSDRLYDAQIYQNIKAKVTFFSGKSEAYVPLCGYAEECIGVSDPENGFLRFLISARRNSLRIVDKMLDGTAEDTVRGVVFGQTETFDKSTVAIYGNAGISNLTALSGMHFSIVVLMLFFALEKLLPLRFRFLNLVILPFVLVCAVLMGMTPSVLRSLVAVLAVVTSRFFYRTASGLSSVAVAVIAIGFIDPYTVTRVGFLLSTSAVVGICCFTEPISDRICRGLRINRYRRINLVRQLCIPVAAITATVPVMIYSFGRLSIVGVLANLLLAYAVEMIMTAVIVGILCSIITPMYFAACVMFMLAGFITYAFDFTARFLGTLAFAGMRTGINRTIASALFIILIVVMAAVKRRKPRARKLICYIVAAVFTFSCVFFVFDDNAVHIQLVGTDAVGAVVTYRNKCLAVCKLDGERDAARVASAVSKQGFDTIDALVVNGSPQTDARCVEKLIPVSKVIESDGRRIILWDKLELTLYADATVLSVYDSCVVFAAADSGASLDCDLVISDGIPEHIRADRALISTRSTNTLAHFDGMIYNIIGGRAVITPRAVRIMKGG